MSLHQDFVQQPFPFRSLAFVPRKGQRAAGWRHELQSWTGTNYTDPVSNPVLGC